MVNLRVCSLLPVLGLAACATTGNIHGDFACAAPGGTCAPMGTIDAAAIASIGSGRTIPMSGGGIDSPRIQRSLSGQVIAVGGEPQRTSDRVLRVVFPAHIDTNGIFREEAAAHAVFEPSEWAQALGVRPQQPRGGVALRAAGVAPVLAQASALATLDEIVSSRAAGAAPGPTAAPAATLRPDMQPVAVSSTPAALLANTPPATMRPALVMPFQSSATRNAQPQSLAEAAAGLEAPRIARLDPRDPAANYDTPDVLGATPRVSVASAQVSNYRAATRRELKTTTQSRQMASAEPTIAAPYGPRPVRWKGRTYQLPYQSLQPASAVADSAVPSTPNPTAALNKAALARSRPASTDTVSVEASHAAPATGGPSANVSAAPAYAPTTDAGKARARVSAMAVPLVAGAVNAGRTSALAAAPGGMKLAFPTKASDLSELA